MNAGSFFTIGSTHVVCEDYALHGVTEDPYVILSDGCSNGGVRIDTDFGSRLLCKSAENHLSMLPYNSFGFKERVISTTVTQVQTYFNMDLACLTATLLLARKYDDFIYTMLIGDGYIGGKRRDGRWMLYEIEYEKGAPYYLKYSWNPKDKEAYFNRFGSIGTLRTFSWRESGDIETSSMEFDLKDDHPEHFEFDFKIDEYEFVFIASDGLSRFYHQATTPDKSMIPIPITTVVPILYGFKGYQTSFVERQMHWVMNTKKPRSLSKTLGVDVKCSDDFSTGVIHCG